jgi:hypothetical protein
MRRMLVGFRKKGKDAGRVAGMPSNSWPEFNPCPWKALSQEASYPFTCPESKFPIPKPHTPDREVA